MKEGGAFVGTPKVKKETAPLNPERYFCFVFTPHFHSIQTKHPLSPASHSNTLILILILIIFSRSFSLLAFYKSNLPLSPHFPIHHLSPSLSRQPAVLETLRSEKNA